LVVLPTTPDGTRVAVRDLPRVRTLITGWTLGSYQAWWTKATVESAALKDGFHLTHAWRGTGFSILVSQRGKAFRTVTVAQPSTKVVHPGVGTATKGNTYLVATSSDDVFAITSVEFMIRGMGQMETVRGWQTLYGWFGALGTEALPDVAMQSKAWLSMPWGAWEGASRLFSVWPTSQNSSSASQ
jgi:hypothetical protein